ncbi:MAG: hypothetical protein GY814_06575, partial [Gammaproteobacteria bacterium]|nr:hypothetical protein [Gammaproteobacteria bacterium]
MQAVIVPLGRISLGRILNVVGSAVDIYDDQPIALVFSQSPVYVGRIAALNTNQLVRTLAATMNEMEVGLMSYSNMWDIAVSKNLYLSAILADVPRAVSGTHTLEAHSVVIVISVYLSAIYAQVPQCNTRHSWNYWKQERLETIAGLLAAYQSELLNQSVT